MNQRLTRAGERASYYWDWGVVDSKAGVSIDQDGVLIASPPQRMASHVGQTSRIRKNRHVKK